VIIWRKRCEYCGEDTFGERIDGGPEPDMFCSVCSRELSEDFILEEIPEITRETISGGEVES